MNTYEVIIHTARGYAYLIEADSAEEAVDIATRGYVEEGDDGEILYEERDRTEVQEVRR